MPGFSNSTNKFGPSSYVVGSVLGDGCNFTTVQDAINQAVADGYNSLNPTTILVRAGNYTGTFTMAPGIYVVGVGNGSNNVPNVTISGSIIIDAATAGGSTYGLENLFISDGGTTVTTINAGVVILDIGNCSIFGDTALTISNISGTFSQITLRDCSFSGTTRGVAAEQHNAVRMNNCRINAPIGITIRDTARVSGEQCNITSTGTYGVEMTGSNIIELINSSVTSAGEAFFGSAVGDNVKLYHCTVDSSAASGFYIDSVFFYEFYDLVLKGTALLSNALAVTYIDWQPHAGTAAVATLPGGIRGTACFDVTDFTVTNGFVELASTPAGTFPVDNGGPGVPLAGAMSLVGSTSFDFPNPSGIETHVGATTNEIYYEDRRWTSSLIVDPDATVGLRGTYTTITAALAAALPLQTIYVRPGLYTESFTLKSLVNIVGLTTPSGGLNGLASTGMSIDGTITADATTGSATIQNLRINPAAGPAIVINGGGAEVTIDGCTILSTTFSIQMIEGNAYVNNCYLSGGVNAIEYDTNGGPTVRANNCRMDSGSSAIKIDTSSTFFAKNCLFVNAGGNCLEAAIVGINVEFVGCQLISNGTNAIDVSGGGSLSINYCEVLSPNASAIECGAGGTAIRSYFNRYSSGGTNYVTGTVASYDYTNDAVNPPEVGGIDSGIVVTNLGEPPFQEKLIGLTTTVGAVSNTIISFDLGTIPGSYTITIAACAYDSATPSGFNTIQNVGLRTDGVTATLVTNSAVLNGGDGPLAAAALSLSTVGNSLIIDADGVGGATANWKCVVSEILFQG